MSKDEDLHIKIDEAVFEKFRKSLEEIAKKREECRNKGSHLKPVQQSIEYMPRKRAWMYCNYCGEFYERPLNAEELEQMEKNMIAPMTI